MRQKTTSTRPGLGLAKPIEASLPTACLPGRRSRFVDSRTSLLPRSHFFSRIINFYTRPRFLCPEISANNRRTDEGCWEWTWRNRNNKKETENAFFLLSLIFAFFENINVSGPYFHTNNFFFFCFILFCFALFLFCIYFHVCFSNILGMQ